MVFLDHGQNLHIHAVRANILMSFSVDFRSEGIRPISTLLIDRLTNMAGVLQLYHMYC